MAASSQDKLIEQIGSMTVLELSDLVKALETTFGVSAAMPVAAAAPTEVAAPAEAKSEYKVTLTDGGSEKIKTIKALRSVVSGIGLSEAKKAVDEVPSVIAESVPKADAEKIKKTLEEAGAKVELS